MRRTNAESPDTFTAKLGFFDRTFAPHTDRLGVSCRVQADAVIETGLLPINGVVVINLQPISKRDLLRRGLVSTVPSPHNLGY